jgi:hypothetical protein
MQASPEGQIESGQLEVRFLYVIPKVGRVITIITFFENDS